MGAWFCDNEHISYLVGAALWTGFKRGDKFRWLSEDGVTLVLDVETTLDAGQMLREQNIRALETRYPQEAAAGTLEQVFGAWDYDIVTWPTAEEFEPVQIIKAADAYIEQSSDTPDWLATPARRFVERLRVIAVSKLPGWREASWGAPENVESWVSLQAAA